MAEFLGFSGCLRDPDGSLRYVRPTQVALDGSGSQHGTVSRRIHEEEGVLCEVTLANGIVQVRSAYPGPQLDERVTLRVEGGVRFPEPGP